MQLELDMESVPTSEEFSLSEAWRMAYHAKRQADHAVRVAESALGAAKAVAEQTKDAVVALERYIRLEQDLADKRKAAAQEAKGDVTD